MSEQACESCGKPADVEITSKIVPLTASGERMYEQFQKIKDRSTPWCVSCLLKAGTAAVQGDFAEEENE